MPPSAQASPHLATIAPGMAHGPACLTARSPSVRRSGVAPGSVLGKTGALVPKVPASRSLARPSRATACTIRSGVDMQPRAPAAVATTCRPSKHQGSADLAEESSPKRTLITTPILIITTTDARRANGTGPGLRRERSRRLHAQLTIVACCRSGAQPVAAVAVAMVNNGGAQGYGSQASHCSTTRPTQKR